MRAETTGPRTPSRSTLPSKKPPTAGAETLDRRQLLTALTRLKKGDFSVRLAPEGSRASTAGSRTRSTTSSSSTSA